MARSSTDRLPRPGAALSLGLWASAVLHVAVLAGVWREAAPLPAPAVWSRPLTVHWVSPPAPAKITTTACSGACGRPIRDVAESPRPSAPLTPKSLDTPLPQDPAPPLAETHVAAAVAAPMAEAASAAAAASTPAVGIAWVPPRWGGFAPSRWGRPSLPSAREPDDEAARQAREHTARMAAQQQQALAELAWRVQAAAAVPQP